MVEREEHAEAAPEVDERSLEGLCIGVTRPAGQAEGLMELLSARGADAVSCPTIRIADVGDVGPLRRAIDRLDSYGWIIFTSRNGVARFWEELEAAGLGARSLGASRIAAIGPGTASALLKRGIRAHLVPEEYVAEAVAEALIDADDLAGCRVLLPRAAGARPVLPDRLRAAGAEVDVVVAYESVPDAGGIARLRRLVDAGEMDMVTFTAASTVRTYVSSEGPVLGRARIATIGPITASAVREVGLRVDVVASEYTVAGLVEAICEYYSD
jgi:uroporphyrinogen III methyltransferase/synthase